MSFAVTGLAGGTDKAGLNLVPWPASVKIEQGEMPIAPSGRVVAADESLLPLAKVLAGDLRMLGGRKPLAIKGGPKDGDIVLSLSADLKGEAYKITVTPTKATVEGGNYQACAWGAVTLLQAARIAKDGRVSLPCLTISDRPAAPVRMVMWDVARQYHPIENLYEIVDLHRMYKVTYMHLFMGAKGLFAFGSKAFPELGTVQDGKVMYGKGLQLPTRGARLYYSMDELKALVRYAQDRGVIVVPQIDTPGWSGQLVDKRPDIFVGPDLFCAKDPVTGKASKVNMVNICYEPAVEGVKTLIGELCETFTSSPYIQIGSDEVSVKAFEKFPGWAQHAKKYNLTNGSEALAHYLYRLDQCVKSHGKTSICWIGPQRAGKGYDVSPGLITMPWLESGQSNAANGFFVIRPGGGCFMPFAFAIQGVPPPYNKILGNRPAEGIYNRLATLKRFENGGSDNFYTRLTPDYMPTTGHEDRIVGSQIQVWQTSHDMSLPAMRASLPALAEPLWNQDSACEHRTWKDFLGRQQATDAVLDRTMRPVKVQGEGLVDPGDITFVGSMKVRLSSPTKGVIRYTAGPDWFIAPTKNSPIYNGPITIKSATIINARLFDEAGNPLGYATEIGFYPIVPKVRYSLYATEDASADLSQLKPIVTSVLGKLTTAVSHRDARMGYRLVLEGALAVPKSGEYEFLMGKKMGQLLIDGKEVDGKTQLPAGKHSIKIVTAVGKDAIRFRSPDKPVPQELDAIVTPLAK